MTKEEDTLKLMLAEFKKIDKIVLLKEEDNVIRSVIHGKARNKILNELQQKYPKEDIKKTDIDSFLLTYRDILESKKVDVEKAYVRRLIKSKTGLNNELIDLAIKAKDMAKRYDTAEDNANAIAAIRTAADILMKFAKVEGLSVEKPEVEINMHMDKVVQNIAQDNNMLSGNIKKILDIEAEDIEELDG